MNSTSSQHPLSQRLWLNYALIAIACTVVTFVIDYEVFGLKQMIEDFRIPENGFEVPGFFPLMRFSVQLIQWDVPVRLVGLVIAALMCFLIRKLRQWRLHWISDLITLLFVLLAFGSCFMVREIYQNIIIYIALTTVPR